MQGGEGTINDGAIATYAGADRGMMATGEEETRIGDGTSGGEEETMIGESFDRMLFIEASADGEASIS